MGYTPHVVVVGGGITGTGIARDLAMRGLEVTLVERGSLSNGTTGRTHGVLHSGARYATDDPETAAACAAENQILRDIADNCIVEKRGLFASLAGDSDEYFEEKRDACRDLEGFVRELSGEEARDLEPALSADVERALVVPDRSIDPFALTRATAESAREHGATIRTYTEVVRMPGEDAVDTVRLRESRPRERRPGPPETIDADYVVNAAGPWADDVAGLAGLDVPVRRSKGAMLVMADSPVSSVLNRCRPRQEGDIVVPFHGNCVLGTTDVEVADPDDFSRPFDAVDGLIDELSAVVPSLASRRPLRAYWGVRPLVGGELRPAADGGTPADDGADAIDASRGFAIVDHEDRDDHWGITSVVGGKLTTYRLVAEAVADHVCAKFGISRPCETAEESLPGSDRVVPPYWTPDRFGMDREAYGKTVARLGHRMDDVLDVDGPNPVICPCEAVTRAELRDGLERETGSERPLTEISQRARIGMGACQGGCCTVPTANELQPTLPVETVHEERARFLQSRWAGQRYALWGDQFERVAANYDHLGRTLNLRDSLGDAGEELTGRAGLEPVTAAAITGADETDSEQDPVASDASDSPEGSGEDRTADREPTDEDTDWTAFDLGPPGLEPGGGSG